MGSEANFPLPKFVTLGGVCIDGNIAGSSDNAEGVTGFTLDISEPGESQDVFVAVSDWIGETAVADEVGERGEEGVEDGTGVADGPGNCPAPQPEIHRPRTVMETKAIHAFVFIISFVKGSIFLDNAQNNPTVDFHNIPQQRKRSPKIRDKAATQPFELLPKIRGLCRNDMRRRNRATLRSTTAGIGRLPMRGIRP